MPTCAYCVHAPRLPTRVNVTYAELYVNW
uniref:Uncharacterized protein n=1 Tax=Anguilla anguilla TaxID=7936 RepID=A0A0E9SN39_ANGAN